MAKIKSLSVLIVSSLFIWLLISCSNGAAGNPLEGTEWKLLFIGKSPVLGGTTVTISFKDGQVGGSAGCNSYSGSYTVKGDSLTIGQIAMTEMFCMDPEGVSDQEMRYLDFLGAAQQFELTDGQLMIFQQDHEALTFEPNS